MIIMTMGKYNRSDFVPFVHKVPDVRNHQIDAEHFFVRKPDAAIHNENIAKLPSYRYSYRYIFFVTLPAPPRGKMRTRIFAGGAPNDLPFKHLFCLYMLTMLGMPGMQGEDVYTFFS